MGKNTLWVTYGNETTFQNGAWFVHIVQAFSKNPDFSFWRWAVTKNKNESNLYMIWRDKNKNARKLENKYYMSREEALQQAKDFCNANQ